jgi:hypothetical protein|mmetsp:Transcript_75211/g.126530  ORF Transcript_75211/g.126530 Transcript_75211/m.126530 type:complete len:200 (+) Transcript_75211:3196-3795(+)
MHYKTAQNTKYNTLQRSAEQYAVRTRCSGRDCFRVVWCGVVRCSGNMKMRQQTTDCGTGMTKSGATQRRNDMTIQYTIKCTVVHTISHAACLVCTVGSALCATANEHRTPLQNKCNARHRPAASTKTKKTLPQCCLGDFVSYTMLRCVTLHSCSYAAAPNDHKAFVPLDLRWSQKPRPTAITSVAQPRRWNSAGPAQPL